MTHTIQHALRPEASGCRCNMSHISACVICGKALEFPRFDVDTCSKTCSSALLAKQREGSL